jgi:pimeloyl-ACP methyl ester carboxylesterase
MTYHAANPTEPRDGYFRSQGLLLHYLEWGRRSDPTLILIHGFLDHGWTWESFVNALGGGFHIVALDCRGHGDSAWLRQGYYHFPDYVHDLYFLIRHLKKVVVTLVGHSMGGTICFLYAGSFPENTQKLILIEGTGPPGSSFDDAPTRLVRWIHDLEIRQSKPLTDLNSLDEAATRLLQKNPRISKAAALRLAEKATRLLPNGRRVWKFDPMHRTTSPQPFYTGQAVAFFRRILCPTLLVRGKESSFFVSDGKERHEAFRLPTQVEIEDAGHMVHVDNPKRLAEVVRLFVEEAT